MPSERGGGDAEKAARRSWPAASASSRLATMVRWWRASCGVSQALLAQHSGLSVGVIRDIEQGRVRHPHRDSLERLARGLDLDREARLELMRNARPPVALRPAAGWPAGDCMLSAAPRARHPAGLALEVLGPLVVHRDGLLVAVGGPQQRAVLGLLAVQPNSAVHREAIIDALWGDSPPASAVAMIQTYISRLRGTLAPGRSRADDLLLSDGACYRLDVTRDQLDLLAFEDLSARARDLAADGNPGAACLIYETALNLWRGDPLVNVDVLRHHPAVADLARLRAATVTDFARVALAAATYDRVLPHLRAQAARDPLDESAHAALITALAGTGQQVAAFDVFAVLRRRLDDQLGVPPSAEVSDALALITHQARRPT
jgi:DNA-binding SARP family transcriptional activator/transcriptional regulator with XRE-family HTH domain